ncbi:hypothetical protein SSX86_024167 [Deinandra increscens subsp. villosa]|uniref:Glycoside hydrolase family 28 n=1 Tax=Deinandra increscens subsp. villosa TaxID=3103831 RepID=A0AAP0GQL2_9ASTR
MDKDGYILRAVILCLFIMALIAANQAAQVSIVAKGAKAGGVTDVGPAILSAWKEACAGPPPASVLIPPGIYLSLSVVLVGPCKGPIEIIAKGATIKAPPELAKFTTDSWITIRNVDKLTMTGGILDGQGQQTWTSTRCHDSQSTCNIPVNLRLNKITNSVFNGLTSLNSKNFHIALLACDNNRFDNLVVNAPGNSVNTDGMHIAKLSGLNITNAKIKTGDDCISFGDGSKNVHISGTTCGPGHGFGVGSLGKYPNEEPVQGIFFRNCTMTGTTNGVRIKTWPESHPGAASDIHFEDIIMNNVANPILIDQEYCPNNACKKGAAPSKVKLTNVSFKKIRGTSSTKVAVKLTCSAGLPCDNVEVGDVHLTFNGGAATSECSHAKPKITGPTVPAVVLVDIKTKGAKGDGITDDGPAILSAWKDACAGAPPGSLLIPPGTYLSLAIELFGPCKGPVEIVAKGATIKAPPELAKFTKDSWITIRNVDKLTMTGGTFDGQGQETWKSKKCLDRQACQVPVNLRLSKLKNSLFKDLTSINSKNFHIALRGSDNSRLENVNIAAPGNSINTDGIHIAKLNGLNVTNTKIGTGDDCISFGEGSRNVHIEGVTCGPGHGFSVGSLGKYPNEEPVEGIFLRNCTMTGTTNGVRIKTWPDSHPVTVSDIHFEDIIMNGVGNPILIDQEYCPNKACKKGAPSKVKLSNVSFRRIRGTSSTKVAVKLACSAGVPCENVEVADINLTFNGGAATSECSNAKTKVTGQNNLRLSKLKNSLFKDLTSINSKNFHIALRGSDNSRLENVNIAAPGNSINTDGIHIAKLNGLNVTNTKIGTGDDCISFGDGSRNVHIEGVTCGPGHGFSVGSLGKYPNEEPVEGIFLRNCTMTGTTNGKGAPSKVKLSNVSFRRIRGTSSTKVAVKLACSAGVPCENVEVADINLTFNGGAATSECSNAKTKVTGQNVPGVCRA